VGDPLSPAGADGIIRSPDNRIVKFVRSLRNRETRWSERAFVVEGYRAVADALSTGARPRLVLVRAGEEQDAAARLPKDLPFRIVTAALFDRLAETVTPQGILAVFPFPELPIQETAVPLVLVIDRLQDPGNLGTLLRSAAGAGASAIVLTDGTVDPYNSKVVRAAMGAHFRIPLRWQSDPEVEELLAACVNRVVADADGEVVYDQVDWTEPSAVIIGSEAHGPSQWGRAAATARARIPLAAGVESLNAAVAGAVMLFEAARQRRSA